MKLNKNFKLPISSFAVEPSFDPERYTKMRIKVMHTGLNLNNTSFGMDAIERAKPTLSNIPLLAFIKSTDGEESADFDGHNFEIKVTEGDLKYVYLGRPVGMIPETNNYEVVQEEDRTYVVVDGYIWNDYANQALDIIERDGGKSVSMEVSIDNYEDKGSYFEINNFKYTGIALLGEDVNPAMVGAKADLVKYSQDAVAEMMAQLKADLEAYAAEEDIEPVEDNTEEPIEDNAKDEEPIADNSEEDNKSEPEEDSSENEEEPEEDNSEPDVEPEEDNSEPEVEPEADEDFEAKYNDLKAEFEALKERNEELESFKTEFEETQKQEKVQELFAKFEDLSGEEFEAIKENALEFSLEDLETKLYAIRGKMVEETKPAANFSFSFNSGSKSKPKEPSWADLVRNRKK